MVQRLQRRRLALRSLLQPLLQQIGIDPEAVERHPAGQGRQLVLAGQVRVGVVVHAKPVRDRISREQVTPEVRLVLQVVQRDLVVAVVLTLKPLQVVRLAGNAEQRRHVVEP